MWDSVRPLNQSEIEEISKTYKPLIESPESAVETTMLVSLQSIIGTSERHADQIDAFLEGLPDEFVTINNGSFHEYDWSLEHHFEAYKYNPKGYDDRARWADYGNNFYDDFTIYYVPNYILRFLQDYGMWALPYENKYHDLQEAREIKAAEVWDFIEAEAPRAVQMWKLSRENYNDQ